LPPRVLAIAALLAALVLGALGLARRGTGASSSASPHAAASMHTDLRALPLAAQGPVSAALGADRRAYQVRPAPDDGAPGFRATNPAQRLTARFATGAVAVRSGGLRVALSLRSIADGATATRLPTVAPGAHGNRVGYARPGIDEWYANGPLGLEQGFTVSRARAASHGNSLVLSLAVSGNARATLSPNGGAVLLRHGRSELSYGGLLATDATGRELASSLALVGGAIELRLDTTGARYPLRIDPLVQQGPKLTGKEQSGGSNLGQSVAISADGDTALVGGPSDAEGGEMLVGAAWVFTRSGSTWTQQGPKLRGGGRVGEGQFGISVALSSDGNTALIGGINDANVGAAWIFTRSGTTWTQQGPKLTGGGEETGDGRFGKSVALSADGNTALVGAYFDNGNKGAAFGFRRSGSTWSHEGTKLTGAGEQGLAQFGSSVALSADGRTALLGGPMDEGATAETMAGAAWAFANSGSGWVQEGGKLTSGGVKGAGELGTSVALSADGSTALVGAPADGASGGARAFIHSGAGWSHQGNELLPNNAVGSAGFGTSVALSAAGNAALIGGPDDEDGPAGGTGPTPSGAAWEFARVGTGWLQQGPKIVGTTSESEFGAAVALAPDNLTALIGGPIDSTSGVMDAGALWVYVNPVFSPLPLNEPQKPLVPTSPIIAPPATRVLVSNVSESRSRWRAGSAQARLSSLAGDVRARKGKRKPHAPLGTTFSFTLNAAAQVEFKFSRPISGRKLKGKCAKTNARNRHKPHCILGFSAWRIVKNANAGTNKLAFQGVVGREKLAPGSYTLVIAAGHGRLGSSSRSLSFTIVK
jgi:FG-GAP repeat protein